MAKVLLYVNMLLVAGTMAATLPASSALSHAEPEASRLGKLRWWGRTISPFHAWQYPQQAMKGGAATSNRADSAQIHGGALGRWAARASQGIVPIHAPLRIPWRQRWGTMGMGRAREAADVEKTTVGAWVIHEYKIWCFLSTIARSRP